MNYRKQLFILAIALGIFLSFSIDSLSQSKLPTSTAIHYDVYERSQQTIHAVTIPHDSNYRLVPSVVGELQGIKEFAEKYNAIAAINGGYFDPVNYKTTSYIVRDGKLVSDPRTNERLIDNPDLQPYLGKILNRVELRQYLCQEEVNYDIVLHSVPVPDNCTLKAALGGGPGLLPQDTSVAEGFIAYQDKEIIRDAIGSNSLNARSAVGITPEGDLILVMVAQQSQLPSNSGMSLPDLADFMSTLGVTKAMNLDGGSSSALYYDGQTFYGKVDSEGNRVERQIKSVLLIY
ncbi:phosphodiester glycosidase family protein [Myxosarcina sp. GI1]|uniref:phosphodiester glycosidase family protein n=1 Tax=Myxosarcina sp. GI1 TaxID=1541065 RepID=UPI000907715D|nr:phosphodiester glycosidase family protein [Myxosarcina sp. GI1]